MDTTQLILGLVFSAIGLSYFMFGKNAAIRWCVLRAGVDGVPLFY